ncbi:MAG: hypothetical protein HOP29_01910 [Phycisphaerales bacterium]|nr:hypothetical protein [Phycisphaerales bacterium]
MIRLPFAQAPWEAFRDTMRSGGSVEILFYLVLGLIAVSTALAAIYRFQARRAEPTRFHLPSKLFLEIIRQLDLSVVQRDLLRRISTDLDLEHPTVILLSPVIFDDHAHRWNLRHVRYGADAEKHTKTLSALRAELFGPPVPAASSPATSRPATNKH